METKLVYITGNARCRTESISCFQRAFAAKSNAIIKIGAPMIKFDEFLDTVYKDIDKVPRSVIDAERAYYDTPSDGGDENSSNVVCIADICSD
jgi:hypothetical protein